MMRILVTGSREWQDAAVVHTALMELGKTSAEVTVVHGGARGADCIAGECAKTLGYKTETHTANWKEYGKKAGYIRNNHMVNLGADICLAFIKDNSKGATMCANLAEKAGIPVKYYTTESEA